MKTNRILTGLLSVALLLFGNIVSASEIRLTDLVRQREMPLSDVVPDLIRNRILFIGEIHDQKRHHDVQLAVIKALHGSGAKVAIGMEMFRKDDQAALDRWVAGESSSADFKAVYYDNWNFSWSLYSDILNYARDEKIPVVGLNVSKDITRQVAKGGFQSLEPQQRKALPMVTCHVDTNYMTFIKKSHGMQGHGQLNLTYFCEAQLVWDKVMAIHALDYLYYRPDMLMIVIAGRGHAWKMRIPAQIRKRITQPQAVMLPRVSDGLISGAEVEADADYHFHSP
ncbi:MAG: ChaN family lipoprotein, partial [Desulfococcus multivorans]|nr:ChaN family lipoprotein [Desulfococcus multivorans]